MRFFRLFRFRCFSLFHSPSQFQCKCRSTNAKCKHTHAQKEEYFFSLFIVKKKYSARCMFNACHKNINWISLLHKHKKLDVVARMIYMRSSVHISFVNCLIKPDMYNLCIPFIIIIICYKVCDFDQGATTNMFNFSSIFFSQSIKYYMFHAMLTIFG